jgi:hypothetical protein
MKQEPLIPTPPEPVTIRLAGVVYDQVFIGGREYWRRR